MYKIMNNPYIRQPFFAADDGGAGGAGGDGNQEENAGGDDPDGEDSDEDGEPEKKYTQAEVDATVEKRLAREKRKWQRSQKEQEKQEEDKKEEDGEGPDKEELKKERSRNQKLTMRLACYEAGVPKDSVKDVTALAKSYMEEDEDLDFEDAIEKVLKKYPQFKGEEGSEKGSWGQRQKGKGAKTEKSLEDEITAALYRE
ncbi:MAG: hypothetical protein Q4C97_04035 [Bacillota bacterium]|nr:hypothetical protein [Bacillota bacterium]CCZ35658.1 putative uncharacterized protein [Firmicutes bacterium CAG:646]